MTRLRFSAGRLLLAALPAVSAVAAEPPRPPDLLLRDFRPRSMLKVPVHEVQRAAFPAVDVHNHVNDARGGDRPVPVPELLAMMDRLNLKRIVILTGAWGDKLQGVVDRMVKPQPDRFTVFTQPDWSRIDEPGFGA